MQQFSFKQGFNSKRATCSTEEQEALVKRRGEFLKREGHARLPWRMTVDGRNRAWLVDARGVHVILHSGNIKLILRALAALEEQGG